MYISSNVRRIFIILATLLLLLSCNKDNPAVDPQPQPEPPTPVAKAPMYVWIDASANFNNFANSKATIAKEVNRLAECGFTDLIVDIRPTEGTVLYPSKIAPEAKRLAAWVGGNYKFVNRTATWDYLQAFIDAGHAAGLRVNVSLNTFVAGYGGYYGLESEGPIFLPDGSPGKIPASWATVQNTEDGLKSSFYKGVQGTVFMNPANEEVQNYLISILKEVAAYDVDGIVLDRCRFDDSNLMSDFSEETREKFSEYISYEPEDWPVLEKGTARLTGTSSEKGLSYPLSAEQKQWLTFRAKVIHDFVEKAAAAVHSVNEKVRFGCYVGAWYSTYTESGVNWASPRYMTHTVYPKWADSDYHTYGYADHCDFMFLGCYSSAKSIYGVTEWTMEGFSSRGRSLLMGDTVFAGGPDIGNPDGWPEGGQGSKIYSTIDAIMRSANGYFVFDLCHIRMYDYWSYFKDAIAKYNNQ